MTELPTPPHVPNWLSFEELYVTYGRSYDKPGQMIAYLRAAVYAQLWLAEAKRIETTPLSELLKKRYVYAQSWTKMRQDALGNADLCAAEMKRIGEKE